MKTGKKEATLNLSRNLKKYEKDIRDKDIVPGSGTGGIRPDLMLGDTGRYAGHGRGRTRSRGAPVRIRHIRRTGGSCRGGPAGHCGISVRGRGVRFGDRAVHERRGPVQDRSGQEVGVAVYSRRTFRMARCGRAGERHDRRYVERDSGFFIRREGMHILHR